MALATVDGTLAQIRAIVPDFKLERERYGCHEMVVASCTFRGRGLYLAEVDDGRLDKLAMLEGILRDLRLRELAVDLVLSMPIDLATFRIVNRDVKRVLLTAQHNRSDNGIYTVRRDRLGRDVS